MDKLRLINEKDIRKLETYAQRVLPSDKAKAYQYYRRFGVRYIKTIETIARATELLPENVKNNLVTAKTITPLIDAFLSFDVDDKAKFVKNERAFRIAYRFASEGEFKGFEMINDSHKILVKQNPCMHHAMTIILAIISMERNNAKGSNFPI